MKQQNDMPNSCPRLGDLLVRARRRKGYNQEVVAFAVYVSNTWLSDVENGRRVPKSDETIREIAKFLECGEEETRQILEAQPCSYQRKYLGTTCRCCPLNATRD